MAAREMCVCVCIFISASSCVPPAVKAWGTARLFLTDAEAEEAVEEDDGEGDAEDDEEEDREGRALIHHSGRSEWRRLFQ